MSGLMDMLFGKPKAAATPAAGPAPAPSADALASIALLQKKIGDLQKISDAAEKQALEAKKQALAAHKKNDKKNALQFMKRAKKYEKQATQYIAMADNLEAQAMAIQTAVQTKDTMRAMAAGNTALKGASMDINEVDKIRDDYEEQMDAVNEMTEALSTPWAAGAADEDDLLAELDALAEEDMTATLATVPAAAPAVASGAGTAAVTLPEFPTVPAAGLPAGTAASAAPAHPAHLADDIAQLEASLA